MKPRINPLAPHIALYEKRLATAQQHDDPEKTLFVQLTIYEVMLISFGLLWVGRLYNVQAIAPLVSKLEALMEAQNFYYAGSGEGGGDA